MKITAGPSRDEVLRKKREWQQNKDEQKKRYDDQVNDYRQSQKAVLKNIEDEVYESIKSNRLADSVDIDADYRFGDLYQVKVSQEKDKFNKDSALSWNWSVSLNENGDIIKDSGSWSGLQATTSKHLQHLKDIVDLLEILNSLDWNAILNKPVPNFSDYVTTQDPRYDNTPEDFDQLLVESMVEDITGDKDACLLGQGDGANYSKDVEVYYQVLRQTDKQVQVKMVPYNYVRNGDIRSAFDQDGVTARMSKSKFYGLLDPSVEIDYI